MNVDTTTAATISVHPRHLRHLRPGVVFTRITRQIYPKLFRSAMSSSPPLPVVCVVSPNKDAYSETFIRAHIERLPAQVRVAYGGWFPRFHTDGARLLPRPLEVAYYRQAGLPAAWRPAIRRTASLFFQRFLTQNRIELVLAEYGPTAVAVMAACQRANVPFVAHFHGFDAYDRPTLAEYGAAYRTMFGVAGAIIAVSRHMEQQLLALGAPRERLFYNVYGVDTARFSGATPAAAPPRFVGVGRFVEKKAPHLALLAFKQVHDACPDARLTLIGDGPLWEVCRGMARALHLEAVVDFPGSLPHAEVATAMRGARAFVQHSACAASGDSEGTPLSVLEASAMGLPIVSTRHAGIPDVVVHGETGFLGDEGDVDGMAAHMLRLAEDATLAATMGQRGQQRAHAHFTLDASIARLWQIIEGILRHEAASGARPAIG